MTTDDIVFRPDPARDFKDPAELEKIQNGLLRKQLAFCRDHSPYYQDLFRGMDFSKFTVRDLSSLPTTDKFILARDPARFRAVPMSEIEDIVFSSGTTGKPCEIVYSKSDMARLAHNEYQCFTAAGMTRDDIVLLTCTLDRCFIAGLAYYLGVRAIGAAAVRNGLNTIESHAEMIRTVRPTVIVGVPSFLRHLGEALKAQNTDVSSVRKLICIGEPVRDREYNITGLGKQIQDLWNADVHSTYASSEIVTSFCECSALRGGHLLTDLVCAEILDEKGNVLPDGEEGELTLTPLQTTGMPLVRFRTGDVTFLTHERCACGRTTPRIGPILGRRAQMLKCKGTTLFPQALFAVLDAMEEILDYYIVVSGEGLSDVIEAFVALRGPEYGTENVSARLRAVCRMNVPVHVRTAEEIRSQVFARSRKPVRFVDRRNGKTEKLS